MLRYQIFLSYAALFLALWIPILMKRDDIFVIMNKMTPGLVSEEIISSLITYAPIWGILCLGIWALFKVIHGVIICKDCPEAAQELEGHVKSAKIELAKRGLQL